MATINGIEYVTDQYTDAKYVSETSHPAETARTQVAWLESHGHVASWAPDNDDRARAWIYVDWK